MFEHLGPSSYQRPKVKYWRHRFVVAFFFSLGIFFLVMLSVQGPSSYAADTTPKIHFQANNQEQRVSQGSTQLQLFELTIDVPVAGLNLRKMKVYVNGLYDVQYLNKLKLFHQGIQLGTLIDFDEQGYLIFDLGDYKLPAGSSQLVITLPEAKDLQVSTIMQFSIESRKDLSISYLGQPLIAGGKFPLVGGVTQIVSRGDWQVFNRSKKSDLVVSSQGRTLLGAIAVSSQAELLDLQTVDFGLEQSKKQKNDNIEFILINDGLVVAEATSHLDKISFVINQPLATKNNSLTNLELYAKDLPVGDYLLSWQNIVGKGYISNETITWSAPMVLSRVHALANYPIFESAKIDPSLQGGWNNVFATSLKASAQEEINFYKFTWYYQAKNTTVRQAQVFVDGEYYPMDVIVKDNSITAKTEWTNPLTIDSVGHQVQLLLDVAPIGPGAVLEAYLQPDRTTSDPENIWASNIIWSAGSELKNSYLLPYLPLSPSIVSRLD